MTQSRLRISLTQRQDEIVGVVDLPGDDPGFVLEALALVVERFSLQSGVTPAQVVQDLYALVSGKVV